MLPGDGLEPSARDRFQRTVRRIAVVLVLLTLGQLFLWPAQDAHRSVFGFVMSLVWTVAALVLARMMLAGPRDDAGPPVPGGEVPR